MVNIEVTGHRNLLDKKNIKIERAISDNPVWLFQRRKLYEKN